jgi:hypothetical protein
VVFNTHCLMRALDNHHQDPGTMRIDQYILGCLQIAIISMHKDEVRTPTKNNFGITI